MGSQTKQVEGTGQYVGPDTSNPIYQQLQSGGKYDPAAAAAQGYNTYMQGIGAAQNQYGMGQNVLAGGILGQAAGLQGLAGSTADAALRPFGQSSRELAQLQSRSAQENVASQLAGSGALNSGAAMKAISAGTARPLLEAETNLANTYANMYGQTANNLYGQAYNNLGQQANLYGQAGNTLAGMYGNLGSQQYGMAGQQLGLLGQFGQSQYIAPQYYQKQGLLGQIAGGIGAGIGGGLGMGLGSGIAGLFG